MSAHRVSAPAQRRPLAALVAVLATVLSAIGLSPVPAANAADPVLSFVGAASSSGNRTSHVVKLPATVQAGDTMVLFMTTNSIGGTLGSPAGWTLLQSKDGTSTRGRAWTKKAVAADANANVTVASSGTIKDVMSVGVYRSNGGTSAVTASASTAGTTSTTSHTTPSVAVAQAGSWLVNCLEREVLHHHHLDQARHQHDPRHPRRHRRRQGQRTARRLQRPGRHGHGRRTHRDHQRRRRRHPALLGRGQPRHRHQSSGQPASGSVVHRELRRH